MRRFNLRSSYFVVELRYRDVLGIERVFPLVEKHLLHAEGLERAVREWLGQ